MNKIDPNGLAWVIVGDYGYKRNEGQKLIAKKMEEVITNEKISIVFNTGDNFYNPDGLTGVYPDGWAIRWASAY